VPVGPQTLKMLHAQNAPGYPGRDVAFSLQIQEWNPNLSPNVLCRVVAVLTSTILPPPVRDDWMEGGRDGERERDRDRETDR